MGYGTRDNGSKGEPGAQGHEPAASSSSSSTAAASPPALRADSTDEGVAPVSKASGYRQHLHEFYERNFGLFLVFSAQTFGSVMSTAAKLLTSQDASNQFHALHIIFVRMLATFILGTALALLLGDFGCYSHLLLGADVDCYSLLCLVRGAIPIPRGVIGPDLTGWRPPHRTTGLSIWGRRPGDYAG
ncbi:hypothetical protein O1611_g10176 [Lasiodiplodia mahajangana]|uniref:Uncharacterized protein n=1 Tax=Lasiodiplodia mahajangana TaxID=1108764 RepID=A0ACC2J128_9PEZI|nr:hypothetical protein O1611_g10176 [Lasiodiplodia mahajangana]